MLNFLIKNWFDLLTSILSIIAIIVSIKTAKKNKELSRQAIELSEQYNKYVSGQLEIQLRDYIRSTKKDVVAASLQLNPTDSDESKKYLLQGAKTAIEENLNAYEEACAKYNDGKIDKERFKKMYFTEIRNLVKSNSYASYFGAGSEYTAILKVYNEWNNLE